MELNLVHVHVHRVVVESVFVYGLTVERSLIDSSSPRNNIDLSSGQGVKPDLLLVLDIFRFSNRGGGTFGDVWFGRNDFKRHLFKDRIPD